MRIGVVVPALNEVDNIGPLVEELLAQAPLQNDGFVIVVDNGSNDGTGAKAADAGAQVITEPRRGYGFACAAGSHAAIARGADLIAYIDGDYSSLPAELARVIDPLVQGRAELVLGSRALGMMQAGAMPPHQRFGNWLTSRLMRFLYGIEVTDLGPYRAIRADLLTQLEMREMTFGWPTEMMVKAARANAHIVEVPVSNHARRGGRSKVSGTVRGSVLAAWFILGVTFRYARAKI